VAHWFGARPAEITFTAGGTEANNLAIHGVMRQFPEANMVVSSVEHESILAPAQRYACREVLVGPDGTLDLEALRAAIDDNTVLVSVMYANNEIGTIQPIREASQIIKSKKRARKSNLPLLFHVDACQAANYLDLHVSRLGADLMTVNSGKIYGPKQCGALFIRTGVKVLPLVDGGGQEDGLRSGTENVSNIVGFGRALDLVQADRHEEAARLKALQQLFMDGLTEKIKGVVINGSKTRRLPNNVHITLPGQDNERLMMALDEKGIQAAVGSACSASNDEPSHVLKAIGLSDAEARSSLRFTMGRHTTREDVLHTVKTLSDIASISYTVNG
jgi:cysteine desulfurase